MRAAGGLALAALALGATGCFPLLTPPLKGDLGYAARLGGDSGYRFSGGVSVASIVPDTDFPLDVGAGYVQTQTKYGDDHVAVHGAYLEGGPRIRGGSFWRVFAGPRIEYYFEPKGPETAFAALGRAEIELFNPYIGAIASEGRDHVYYGVAFGTIAIGAYIEAGYQHLPNEAAYPLLGGGLLLRIPATAGILCCAWDFSSKK